MLPLALTDAVTHARPLPALATAGADAAPSPELAALPGRLYRPPPPPAKASSDSAPPSPANAGSEAVPDSGGPAGANAAAALLLALLRGSRGLKAGAFTEKPLLLAAGGALAVPLLGAAGPMPPSRMSGVPERDPAALPDAVLPAKAAAPGAPKESTPPAPGCCCEAGGCCGAPPPRRCTPSMRCACCASEATPGSACENRQLSPCEQGAREGGGFGV